MNIASSIRRLSLVFMALFIAASVGLVYWQVVVAQPVASNPVLTLGRKCLPDSTPKRGRIFDRNGVLLAYSEPVPANTNNPNAGNLCVYQRVYTHPSMAPIIGYYVSPIFCAETPFCEAGVEKYFDDYLSGNVGFTGLNNTVKRFCTSRPLVTTSISLSMCVYKTSLQRILTWKRRILVSKMSS